jgi:small acid-soluble spore protein F (minor alpha/beta-type SASP)
MGNIILFADKDFSYKGGIAVSRRKSMMSEQLKQEIAKELGVYDTVKADGWGSVSSRDCGNIVSKAIEMAERSVQSK